MRHSFLPAVSVAFLAFAGTARAHPKLVFVSPAENAIVATPAQVDLQFSEKLIPQFSKADLMMTGTSGTASTKLETDVAVASDGRTLVITPKAALQPGGYSVAWRAVSVGTHHVSGTCLFAVK